MSADVESVNKPNSIELQMFFGLKTFLLLKDSELAALRNELLTGLQVNFFIFL